MTDEMGIKDLTDQDKVDANLESKEVPDFQKLYELSDSDKEDIVRQQNTRLKASLQYMTNIHPGWIKAFKKYRSIAEPLKDAVGRQMVGRANLYIPYPWAIIETEMPRLAGRLPRVHAFPRHSMEEKKIQQIQNLIYYSLDRMGFLRLQQLWLRQYEIYGMSPLVYYWRNETKKVFERVKDPELGTYKIQRTEKVIWDDFAGRVIDVFDSFLQPGVDQIEDGDWWMFREYVSEKDLKDRVAAGTLYPEVLNYTSENKTGSAFSSRQNDTGRAERDSLISNLKDNVGFSQHSYGRYELIWTLESNRVIAMLDGKVLAACGDNPEPLQRKAMINLNLMPQVNEPIGISTIEALAGLPDKLNALSNARMDNISLLVNRVILANRFAPIDFDNLIMTAGNVIFGGQEPDKDIKVLDIPDIGDSSAREIMTTKEELQFTTGISDFIVGVKSSARLADTATGVSTIVREGNARFALKLATYEAYPLRRLVEAIHTYNMTFMPEEKRIHVLGPNGYLVQDIKLDDILCECDFIIEPGSSMPLDQLSRRDAFLQLLDRAMQLPQIVDLPKILKEVFASFEIPSPEDYLLKKDMVPEAEDVQLAQAENIALAQGQQIALIGNDQLHMMVHQRGLVGNGDPEAMQRIQDHIAQHQQRLTAMVQPALAQGQTSLFGGGQNGSGQSLFGGGQSAPKPTQAPPSPTPGGAGAGAAMGGGAGLPQGPGAGA